jgi:hypothetical protein
MDKRTDPLRIYVSRPALAADTFPQAAAMRKLHREFPGAAVVSGANAYKSPEDWLARYRAEVALTSALVFLAARGTIGYCAHCEMVAADKAGIPVFLLEGGKLYASWDFTVLGHGNPLKRFARVRARGPAVDPLDAVVPRARTRRLPSGALGRVIENRIIEYLLVLSEGRLIVYRPEADFSGTDLYVSPLHREAVLKLQVKGRTDPPSARFLRFGVRPETIPESDPKHLLFVHYNLKTAELGRFVWAIPSAKYRALARLVHGQYKCDLATKATAADKWVDFRYNTKDIAWVVEALLRGGNP